jgi:hypothetical protein
MIRLIAVLALYAPVRAFGEHHLVATVDPYPWAITVLILRPVFDYNAVDLKLILLWGELRHLVVVSSNSVFVIHNGSKRERGLGHYPRVITAALPR